MADSPSTPSAVRQFVQRLPAGSILFKEGDADRRVFVLLDGRVEILKEGERLAEVGVVDTFIGEVSALTGKPRWATARTTAVSTLLVVDDVLALFRADASWGLKMARVLADRLDRTNERLKRVQLLLEETRSRDGDRTLVETLKLAVGDGEKDRT
jgi:CRP-like cAMP-binding protein